MNTTINKKKSKGGGIAGLLFGILLFVVLTFVLFNNEGNSVKRAKALKNISDAVEVSSDAVMSENEGALVIFSGLADTNATLADDEFAVTAPASTLKMRRSVEMYQWHEKSEEDDNDVKTYSYYLDWSDSLIDSTNFGEKNGHQNPVSIPYEDLQLVADDIYVDAFFIGG